MAPRKQGPPPLRKMILPALFVGGLFYVTFTRHQRRPSGVLNGEALGTTWTLKLTGTPDEARQAALSSVVRSALAEVDKSMSTYRG